jgi:hypothetical protein
MPYMREYDRCWEWEHSLRIRPYFTNTGHLGLFFP